MSENNRNRQGEKDTDREDRTGKQPMEKTEQYTKIPENATNPPDESVSTADNTAGGKYSKMDKRDDEVNNEDTRGGR